MSDTDEMQPVDKALELLRHSARVSPILQDAVAAVEQGVRELREAVGRHDPTGADHMEEMMRHAERADALLDILDDFGLSVRVSDHERVVLQAFVWEQRKDHILSGEETWADQHIREPSLFGRSEPR